MTWILPTNEIEEEKNHTTKLIVSTLDDGPSKVLVSKHIPQTFEL